VFQTLSRALAQHGQPISPLPAQPLPSPAPEPATGAESAVAWTGWPVVQRRIRLLQADADKIIVHSEAIVHNVAQQA
jgi:hypothetical protein